MPIVNSHIVPQVACPGDNPLLALLEEKPGAGILNRVSCVIGHNEWARMIRLEASWLCKPVVVGSSPTGSTNFTAPSSSGLGHLVFNQGTSVRIRLGLLLVGAVAQLVAIPFYAS